MSQVLADTSVLLKWFHPDGEDEVPAAMSLLAAHRTERADVVILDLTLYELGNILLRSLHWSSGDTADQLEDLILICGMPLALDASWRRDAALLAEQHRLTFYDAAFAGAARGLQIPLVTADHELLASGLAERVSAFVHRMRLD
jgi:predicted nucleic acid-binding protein